LRFIREKGEEFGELYEYIPGGKSLFLFKARAEKSGELLIIKILPQLDDRHTILRTVLLRSKIRGKFRKDETMPFAFVLKEIDEINI